LSKVNIPTVKLQTDTISSRVRQANDLLESGDSEAALTLASEELDEFPDSLMAMYTMTRAFIALKRPGYAQLFAKNCLRVMDTSPDAWVNMGLAYQLSYDIDKSIACNEQALRLDPEYFPALNNLSLSYVNNGDPMGGMEYAHRGLKVKPDHVDIVETMGFAHLMMHKWTPGWNMYNLGLGRTSDRTIRNYHGVPDWNGAKGKTVVLYGEQGIGDEVCFSQVVPDMMKDCNLIVETCQTLYKLFKESFDCPVYETRYVDNPYWLKNHKVDAKLSFGQAMERYRSQNQQFTGKRYLRANPIKRKWWRAILDQYPGKKIGIAWNAGLPETGKKRRSIPIKDLIPILNSGETYVSLEYKDTDIPEGVLDLSMFINGHKNYEDTAALVMELDHVIAPTTAVVDLCGALGKKCDVFIPTVPHWRYYGENVWYDSVNYVRQKGNWSETIEEYMERAYA
jgi:tetratricopeptide (TPR) repeat protein